MPITAKSFQCKEQGMSRDNYFTGVQQEMGNFRILNQAGVCLHNTGNIADSVLHVNR